MKNRIITRQQQLQPHTHWFHRLQHSIIGFMLTFWQVSTLISYTMCTLIPILVDSDSDEGTTRPVPVEIKS